MAGKFKDYTLGRGKLWFSRFMPNTQVGEGFRFLGNAPAFNLSETIQNLDHYSSTEGVREKDDTMILQLDRNAAITLDSMDSENVAMFVLGDVSTVSQASTTGTKETIAVRPLRSYKLGLTLQAAGVSNVASVVVKDNTDATKTYVLGTDYNVDLVGGWMDIPVGSTIPANGKVDVTFNVTAQSFETITVPANTQPQEGSLYYQANNPRGTKRNVFIPYVQMSPNGDFQLIGDTWQQMQFNLSILRLSGQPPMVFNGPAQVTGP